MTALAAITCARERPGRAIGTRHRCHFELMLDTRWDHPILGTALGGKEFFSKVVRLASLSNLIVSRWSMSSCAIPPTRRDLDGGWSDSFLDLPLSSTTGFAQQQQVLEIPEIGAMAIAGLATLIGGVGITNKLSMSVFERTREIGVLRALGWHKGHVLTMIL